MPKENKLNLDFMEKNELGLSEMMDALEVTLVVEAIKKCGGNYSAAARLLQINRTTLMMKIYKIQKFDVALPLEKGE